MTRKEQKNEPNNKKNLMAKDVKTTHEHTHDHDHDHDHTEAIEHDGHSQGPRRDGDELDLQQVATFEYTPDDDESNDDILLAEEEVEIEVAQDSGCVCHVASPKDVPGGIILTPPDKGRKKFVSASKHEMKNYGKAHVNLVQEDGSVLSNNFQITDVSRPLHSTGMICDEKHEVLFTATEATVVPEGTLSILLAQMKIKPVARYPRRGGLYVAKMKARHPKKPDKGPFVRQGTKA